MTEMITGECGNADCACHALAASKPQYPAEDYDLQGMLDQIAEACRDQHAQLTSLREQNERLREALRQCVSFISSKDELAKAVVEPHVLKLADEALNHAEQGEGSND